jgi:plastocyanin
MMNTFRVVSFGSLLGIALFAVGCSKSSPPPSSESRMESAPAKPVAYYHVDPATAGEVTGKITFSGKAPARKKIDMDEDPQCAGEHKGGFIWDESVEVGSKHGLGNVFVYIKKGLEDKKFEPPADPVVVDQHGCWFEPRIIAMQAGQALKVTNSDPVTHNIHPRSEVNREWNQNQPSGAPPVIRKFFDKPEVMIRVKCNIHPWMKAWIGVVDNPYFAVTKSNGEFDLKNVPPGTYTLEAWQEELGTQEQQVTVAASGKATAEFAFKGE